MTKIRIGKVSTQDTGKKGLDNIEEIRRLASTITRNVNSGKMSRALGIKELRALKLRVLRDEDFKSPKKRKKALKIIKETEQKIG